MNKEGHSLIFLTLKPTIKDNCPTLLEWTNGVAFLVLISFLHSLVLGGVTLLKNQCLTLALSPLKR